MENIYSSYQAIATFLIASIVVIVIFYFRYFFIWSKYGVSIGSIGFGVLKDVRNYDSRMFQSLFDISVTNKPLFHVGTFEMILGSGRVYGSDGTNDRTKSWINILARDVDLSILVRNNTRTDEENMQLNTYLKNHSGKSTANAVLILETLGLLSSEGQLSLMRALYFPIGVIFRYFGVLLMGRLVSVKIENIKVKMVMPSQGVEFTWHSSRMKVGSEINAEYQSTAKKQMNDFLPGIKRLWSRRMKMSFMVEGLLLEAGSSKDTKENILEKVWAVKLRKTEVNLLFVIGRFTSTLSDPSAKLNIDGLTISVTNALKLFKYVQTVKIKRENNYTDGLDNSLDDTKDNLYDYKKLEDTVFKGLSKLLLFQSWSLLLSLRDLVLEYSLDDAQTGRFIARMISEVSSKDLSLLRQGKDANLLLSIRLNQFYVKLDSNPEMESSEDGAFLLESGIEGLSARMDMETVIPSAYFNNGLPLLNLGKLDFLLEVPYGFAFLMVPEMNFDLKTLGRRMFTFNISIDDFGFVLDFANVAALSETLTEEEDFDLSLVLRKRGSVLVNNKVLVEKKVPVKSDFPIILPSIETVLEEFGLECSILLSNIHASASIDSVEKMEKNGFSSNFILSILVIEEVSFQFCYDQGKSSRVSSTLNDKWQNAEAFGYVSSSLSLTGIDAHLTRGPYVKINDIYKDRINKSYLLLPRIDITLNGFVPIHTLSDTEVKIQSFFEGKFKSSDLKIVVTNDSGFDTVLKDSIMGLLKELRKQEKVSQLMIQLAENERLRSLDPKPKVFVSLGKYEVALKLQGEINNYLILLGVDLHKDTLLELSLRQVKVEHELNLIDRMKVINATTKGDVADIVMSSLTFVADKPNRLTLLRLHTISALQGLQKGSSYTLGLNVDLVTGEYGLYSHLVLFRSFKFVHNLLMDILLFFKQKKKAADDVQAHKEEFDQSHPFELKLNLSRADIRVLLPENVKMNLLLNEFVFTIDFQSKYSVMSLAHVGLKSENQKEIFQIESIKVDVQRPNEKNAADLVKAGKSIIFGFSFGLSIRKAIWFLPHDYNFSEFIEGVTILQASLKQLHELGITEPPPLEERKKLISERKANKVPFDIRFYISEIDIVLEDDPFDGKLNRIHKCGFLEQKERIQRIKFFESRVEKLKNSIVTKLDKRIASIELINEAFNKLMELQSMMWISRINNDPKTKIQQHLGLDCAPLVHILGRSIAVALKPPNLKGMTVPEAIHSLDPTTPLGLLYGTLVAFQVELEFSQFSYQLRDFPVPFISIPYKFENKEATTKLSGLFIISEAITDLEKQTRYIQVTAKNRPDPKPFEALKIARTIIPPKIYTDVEIQLTNSNAKEEILSQFTFGPGLEPHLSDMNRAFARISPESVDPSEKLAFWDKFRLHCHGNLNLVVPENAGFKIKLLGTRNMHEAVEYRGSGIDIMLKKGVKARMTKTKTLENNKIMEEETSYTETGTLSDKTILSESFKDINNTSYAPIQIEVGEILALLPYKKDGLEMNDFMLAQLNGGVFVTITPDIETVTAGTHVDVFTKSPEFVDEAESHDSFRTIRTKSLTFNFTINAPSDRVELKGRNYFKLSHEVISHFEAFGSLYSSPITLIPVRSGPLYYPPPLKAPKTQKLSRYMKGINIHGNLRDLLFGYSHYSDEDEIGVRGIIDDIKATIFLQQENFICGRKGANWEIMAADFDITGLTLRTVRRGHFEFNENGDFEEDVHPQKLKTLSELHNDSKEPNWLFENELESEKLRNDYPHPNDSISEFENPIEMNPLLWAPKVVYFRHGSHSFFESIDDYIETGESIVPERDVNIMQANLLKERLIELTNEIDRYKNRIKYWQDRIYLFNDELLKKQSENLMSRLETLFEKKRSIESQFTAMSEKIGKRKDILNRSMVKRKSESFLRDDGSNVNTPRHLLSDDEGGGPSEYLTPKSGGGLFVPRHKRAQTSFAASIFKRSRHNSESSQMSREKNIEKQYKRKEFLHRFVVHNLSVLWNKKVRNDIFKLADLEQYENSSRYFVRNTAIRVLREAINNFTLRSDVNATERVSRDNGNDSDSAEVEDTQKTKEKPLLLKKESELTASGKVAQKLLQQLIKEKNTDFVVEDEAIDQNDANKQRGSSKRSLDPSDPLFVSPEYSIYNDFMIQCFYPQFNFETTGAFGEEGCVVVCAENACLKSANIVDEEEDNQEISDSQLVKQRREIIIQNAQFFSSFKNDVYKSQTDCGLINSPEETPWPIWVPMECVLDTSLPTIEFKRFVDKATVMVLLNQCSPLYIRKNAELKDLLHGTKPKGIADDASELEHVNTTFVKFPKMMVTADSSQYCSIYDVISNVLIYNDPTRKFRNEQISTVLFALLKEDLTRVVQILSDMQANIRSLEEAALRLLSKTDRLDVANQYNYYELKHRLSMAKEELVFVTEALKKIAFERQNQGSAKKSSRTIIDADELEWNLLQDDSAKLCGISISGIHYSLMAYEDRSKVNTIEMDKLSMINHLEPPIFSELVGPYLPDGRKVNFERHQMIRVYWRELAPVAGIPIVDHFEINIFPLLFQMTYVLGKALSEYLYPKKKMSAAQKSYDTALKSDGKLNLSAGNLLHSVSASNILASTEDTKKDNSNSESSTNPYFPRVKARARASTGVRERQSVSYLPISRSRAHSTSSVNREDRPSSSDNITQNEDPSSNESLPDETQLVPLGTTMRQRARNIKKLIPSIASRLSRTNKHNSYTSELLGEHVDVKMMKDRASQNKTFVYIKVPGSTHCISYHGEKEKNIEDLYQLVLKIPTLEYHNKTWTWYEFMIAVRNDIGIAILGQTGSLVRDKIMKQKPRISNESQNSSSSDFTQ